MRAHLQRPSVIVGAWTLLVVGVFVWRGDLRLASASTLAAGPVPLARPAPTVVRAPAAPAAAATTIATVQKGRVFDALGFLVVGAEVVPMDRPATRTDGDGGFQVELRGASTDLLVRADGLQAAWLRTCEGCPDVLAVQLSPTAPWDVPTLPPAPPSPLRGEGIVQTTAGAALAGAFVTVAGTALWARTDDLGRFAIPLPTPSAVLHVHEPQAGVGGLGFAAVSAPIVATRTRGAMPVPDLVAAPAMAIRGVVRDAEGQPLAGVPIEIVGAGLRRLVETGAGGAFRLGGLLAGTYRVQPFAHRGAIGVAHELALAGGAVDVDLQLVRADEVRLRVVDEGGAPAPHVYVAANVGGARRGVAQADAAGYAAVPVAVATEFDVRTAENFTPVTVRRFDAEPPTLVVAMP